MSAGQETERDLRALLLLWLVLIVIGGGWGFTGPLSKLSVSTGNHPVGVTFWGTFAGALLLSLVAAVRGKRISLSRPYLIFYLISGFLGTALPNSLSYTAYKYLPIGINMIVISLVPMVTLIIAVPLGLERIDRRRLAGLALGIVAVLMIFLPDTSLPDAGQAIWIALPIIGALCYALEGVYLASSRPEDLDTLTVMCGLFWGALVFITPLMWVLGAWVDITAMGPPELAIMGNTFLHIGAYLGYIWMIARAGPVFASQVGYVVTGSGVILGMIFYGERHSLWVWGALALIVVGLSLVRPKKQRSA